MTSCDVDLTNAEPMRPMTTLSFWSAKQTLTGSSLKWVFLYEPPIYEIEWSDSGN